MAGIRLDDLLFKPGGVYMFIETTRLKDVYDPDRGRMSSTIEFFINI